MRTFLLPGLTGAMLLGGVAEASLLDWEERRRQALEMDQVRTGDYTYQIHWNGTITPRCDRHANHLRRTRDPRTLRFPVPCGESRGVRRGR